MKSKNVIVINTEMDVSTVISLLVRVTRTKALDSW